MLAFFIVAGLIASHTAVGVLAYRSGGKISAEAEAAKAELASLKSKIRAAAAAVTPAK